jgi:hypothetical protein|tara:strand:+ start:1367 stop:1621 length:255 start_codon:yes stop_codon:yes gene_type:complete
MRSIEQIIEDISAQDDTSPELLNELFWSACVRGLGSGVASWGRLFADVRGWTKGGGDNAEKEEERITDAEAAALVRAVLGSNEL